MNTTIWKFPLVPDCILELPEGAQILTAREQGDAICLWAMVDPGAIKVRRKFVVFGIGSLMSCTAVTGESAHVAGFQCWK